MTAADEPPQSKSAAPIRARHFRAPQGDGETLIEPSLGEIRQRIGLLGEALIQGDVRTQPDSIATRQELIRLAIDYSSLYLDVPEVPTRHLLPRLILAGHQPELFHPGVWLKNFVLDQIGYLPNCLAVNLVIDNDVAGNASIRIPAGDRNHPHLAEIPIDEPAPSIPFEERRIQSKNAVRGFPARLREQFKPQEWFASGQHSELVSDQLWRHCSTLHGSQRKMPLGEFLSRARHRLEQNLGLQTLELPLSHLARTLSFRRFVLQIWRDLPRFHEIYNRSLAEYRIVNRIRSSSHPVPELATEGEFLEAPFWIWTADDLRRRRLFVARHRNSDGDDFLEVSDRKMHHLGFNLEESRLDESLNAIDQLEAEGIKIRPRALITTMYARLFLSDLFIHGIGGAKYDELTDAIIRRFFGIEPPEYLTVTGTVRLPIPRPTTTAADVRSTKQLIREIRFHPERFINDASPAIRESAAQFAEKKKALLREHQFHFRRATPEQFRALDDLNRQLSVLLTDVEIRLRDELKTRERESHDNKLLGSREFSFVLHPADELPEQLKRMAQGTHHAPS